MCVCWGNLLLKSVYTWHRFTGIPFTFFGLSKPINLNFGTHILQCTHIMHGYVYASSLQYMVIDVHWYSTIHHSTRGLLSTMPVEVVIMTLWERYLREEQTPTHVTGWVVCRSCMSCKCISVSASEWRSYMYVLLQWSSLTSQGMV